jgi:uncharacterized protein
VTAPSRPRGHLIGLERALALTYLERPGMEVCGLWRHVADDGREGWALRGSAVFLADAVPTEARYRVVADAGWMTTATHVGVVLGGEKRALRLHVGADNRWFAGDREIEEVRGCVDVDLGLGASTNTLPIRRLGLAVGGSAELTAAWVRFPDLSVERLRQRYTRLAERVYRYESVDSGFTADLEVDDLGLVLRYPGWCEQVRA